MKPDSPLPAASDKANDKKDDEKTDSYRFVDEKISDESGTETKSDSALKPAGLNNPFWK